MESTRLIIETDDEVTKVTVVVGREIVRTKKFFFSELDIHSGKKETYSKNFRKLQEEINAFQTEMEEYEVPDHFFDLLSKVMDEELTLSINELIYE